MDHGTRRSYQSGCRCLSCSAANAEYIAKLRATKRTGKAPLGALFNAQEAARIVKRLLVERYTRASLAKAAGLERHTVNLTQDHRIRLVTLLKLRRQYRMVMAGEGPDQPNV